MIVFTHIRWKNLLSTGNTFTEIPLNESPNALIVGENGAGKSTILDALCFSLFGKPFRKINKPGLVNSINKKDCLVEVEFKANNKRYKVIRGIKPNKFEIWCDDVCLNQDSSSRDYQEHLEKFILKMNYKSFTQIVILGSASFTPFMQLTPADRRVVIEDLLDIQVFSIMNMLVKQRLQENKENLEKNRIEGLGKKETKEHIERTIKSLRCDEEKRLKELEEELKEEKIRAESIEKEIQDIKDSLDLLPDFSSEYKKVRSRNTKLVSLKADIQSNYKRHVGDHDFYHSNDNCPTCKQEIDPVFRTEETSRLSSKIQELDNGIQKITDEIEATLTEMEKLEKAMQEAAGLKDELEKKEFEKSIILSGMSKIRQNMINLTDYNSLLDMNKEELAKIESVIEKNEKQRKDLLDDRTYIETAMTLLKDGGIKTKIIKQYLPLINKLINKYLLQMNFFVNFNIDENFNESIQSRYRDDFSYQNFSEGEKTRINLALLFAWRGIAKIKNSVSTNLLVFDEIFDGSLDDAGTEEFLKIVTDLAGDSNIFVISHKTDVMLDKFDKVYRFAKVKNYSTII